jgi:short-subunit dehydrogenase
MRNNKAINAKIVVIIIAITSDIGIALAKKYSKKGYTIVGTYRSDKQLNELKGVPNCHLFYCDISAKNSIAGFIKRFAKLRIKWDILISCAATQEPIGLFFQCDFNEWSSSIHVNAIEQLRVLHALHRFRRSQGITSVILFAGGGTNNPVTFYSAYTVSKIMLIKMCELLDDENPDMNIFIIGPGWVKTKIHYQTLKAGDKAGKNYNKTKQFIAHGIGTSMDDIYDCIERLIKAGKNISSGRNFSVVHDKWRGDKLMQELRKNVNMYKLRRFKNEWGK